MPLSQFEDLLDLFEISNPDFFPKSNGRHDDLAMRDALGTHTAATATNFSIGEAAW